MSRSISRQANRNADQIALLSSERSETAIEAGISITSGNFQNWWRDRISAMPNGKKGDHPITDIVSWKIPRFSPKVDALIAEIVQLGGQKELERTFDLFQPPPLDHFEIALQRMRDRLWQDAKEGGWEV